MASVAGFNVPVCLRLKLVKNIARLLLYIVVVCLLYKILAVGDWVVLSRFPKHSQSDVGHHKEKQSPVKDLTSALVNTSVVFHKDTPSAVQTKKVMTLMPVMEERLHHLKQACTNHTATYGIIPRRRVTSEHLVYYQEQDLIFCQVYKVGSTNINRVFDFMSRNDNYKSPFDIKWKDMVKHQKHPPLTDISKIETSHLNKSLKVLFARDPYYRIFSAYMDKIYFPNFYFWYALGVPIIKKFRPRPSAVSLRCGHSVTFPEVIKYIIEGMKSHKLDAHFAPMHEACQPCQIKYDVIGKMETFQNDLKFIWNSVNTSRGLKLPFPDVTSPSDTENIDDKALMVLSSKAQLSKCMNFNDVLQRAWRALQIRGMLGRNVTMPEMDASKISQAQLKTILHQAYRDSGSRSFMSHCKKEALIEAYSSVPLEDLIKLKQILKPDCDLFSYDCEPDYVFNRTAVSLNTYKYFDVL